MKQISEILKQNNFKFNKQFGQNFITDTNLLSAMVSDSGITKDDVVVEIGPGAGTLTRQLALEAKKVYAFEIDRNLEPILNETLEGLDNVEVIYKDVQKVKDEEIIDMVGKDYKVVANLPYYITTPLIMRFLECDYKPKSITIMIQKEVGERLMATNGTAEYGVITLAIALEGQAKVTRIVPRQMFMPQPNVDSCIVRIDLNDKYKDIDKKAVKRVVKAGFAMRRKTLVNNLVMGLGKTREDIEDVLVSMGLDPRIRGEVLDIDEYIKLTNLLNKKG